MGFRRRSLAIALCIQFSLFTQISSGQILSRFKDRKATKEQQQKQQSLRLVPQPLTTGVSQSDATEGVEPNALTDQNRIKPAAVSITVAQPGQQPLEMHGTGPQSGQVSSIATIPHISIETSGPAEVNLGRRARYIIAVRNNGDTPSRAIVLHAKLPSGAELIETDPKTQISDGELEYLVGELAPKGAAKLEIELIPRQRGSMDLKTNATISSATNAQIRVRCPELAVKFTGPPEAIVGDRVKFKAIISNIGDGIAENVSVVQVMPPRSSDAEVLQTNAVLQQSHSRIERLLPDQSEELELSAVAASAGLMRANILVKGSDGIEARAEAEVRVRQASIEIKAIGPDSRTVQRTGGYVILVSNTGEVAAERVLVTAGVPKGLEIAGIEKRTMFDKKTNTLTWNLAHLAAGATESLKFQVKAVEEGEHRVEVSAAGEHKLSARTAHVVHVSGKADLNLTLNDCPGPIEVGGRATYEVRVKNCGTKAAQNACLTCTLPQGMEVESSPDFKQNGMTLEFAPIESLAAGEEMVLRLSAVGREAGDHVIRFRLECDILTRELTAETSTFYFKAEK